MDGKSSCIKKAECLIGEHCINEHRKCFCTHVHIKLLILHATDKPLLFSTDLFLPALFLQTMWFNSTKAQKKGRACVTGWVTCTVFEISVLECFTSFQNLALPCNVVPEFCCNSAACGVHVTNMHSYATSEVLPPLLLLLVNCASYLNDIMGNFAPSEAWRGGGREEGKIVKILSSACLVLPFCRTCWWILYKGLPT